MLLIEGSDDLGKTTLAHACVEEANRRKIPAFYSHMSKPPASWDYYYDYLNRMQPFAVQDRFHLGGVVWGNVARGGTQITDLMMQMLTAALWAQGSFTVVLTCDPEFYRERIQVGVTVRKQMYDVETMYEANRHFARLKNTRLGLGVDKVVELDRGRPYLTLKEHNLEVGPGEERFIVDEWEKRLIFARNNPIHEQLHDFSRRLRV